MKLFLGTCQSERMPVFQNLAHQTVTDTIWHWPTKPMVVSQQRLWKQQKHACVGDGILGRLCIVITSRGATKRNVIVIQAFLRTLCTLHVLLVVCMPGQQMHELLQQPNPKTF